MMASSSRRYHTIPYPQNPGFYGRNNMLQAIAAAFEEQAPRIASVALWGTAGIGKTQIALEVAHKHWSDGAGATLWIACDTSANVTQSFNNAALHLQLEGYSEANAPERNRHLVLQWLENTDVPWLLVFDAVKNHEKLVQNWPTVGRGRILMTCRSELLAECGPIATALEIPAFTVAESTKLILRILNNKSPAAAEVAATDRLSTKLGGHALAVDMIARQIKASREFNSVAEYLPHFEQNQSWALKRPTRDNGNLWYSKSLNTLWHTSFENLSDSAGRLLGVLCFMSSEPVPLFLFKSGNWDQLGLKWPLLENMERFGDVLDNLLDYSLVRLNSAESLVSVHRLIQQSYFARMTAECRAKALQVALVMLRAHFPRQLAAATHFWLKWDRCDSLQQHVMAFNERYRSMQVRDGLSRMKPQHAELIRDHAWYLVETQNFCDAETSLLSLLKDTNDNTLEAARIHRILIGLYERTGRSKKACAAADTEFALLPEHFLEQDANIANAHSNVGYTLVSSYRASEAIVYLDKAVDIAKTVGELTCYQDYNIDRLLRNRGRCRAQLGQVEKALKDFLEAEIFQARFYGPDSHYDGETKYERAKLAARQGDFKAAEKLSREAHAVVSAGKPEHASVAAALYQRARVSMLQEKKTNSMNNNTNIKNSNKNGDSNNETALQHLQQALTICKSHEPRGGNKGEAARVRWRMALLCDRMGRVEQASRLRSEAERVRRELLATGEYAVVPTGLEGEEKEESEWDALVGLLYR